MTAPDPPPRWQALRVGPGGIPPEHVRPVPSARFPAAPPQRPPVPADHAGAPTADAPPQRMWPMPQPGGGPSAVLGSFDDGRVRPSRRAVWGWVALALAAGVIVATALWSSGSPRAGGAAPAVGDCLSADDGASSVVSVDCASGDADFRVVARFDGTAGTGGAASCAALHPDLAMIAGQRSVLCLDYVARVGECLFAGEGGSSGPDEIGKRPCGDAYRGTSDLYRVLAVMPGATDDSGCPVGTLQALVHRTPAEVVCLGFP